MAKLLVPNIDCLVKIECGELSSYEVGKRSLKYCEFQKSHVAKSKALGKHEFGFEMHSNFNETFQFRSVLSTFLPHICRKFRLGNLFVRFTMRRTAFQSKWSDKITSKTWQILISIIWCQFLPIENPTIVQLMNYSMTKNSTLCSTMISFSLSDFEFWLN